MTDRINPKHYKSHPSGVECIQVTRHMSFNLGNVVKYLWRAGLKDGAPTLEDLKKAAWYLHDEIKREDPSYRGVESESISNRLKWAETLIQQLPSTHEGRNSWLLNYGVSDEARELRHKFVVGSLGNPHENPGA